VRVCREVPVETTHAVLLGSLVRIDRDAICDPVILLARQDAFCQQILGSVVRAVVDYPLRTVLVQTGETGDLLNGRSIQVERMIAAPSLANSLRYRFRILFQGSRGLGSLLPKLVRILFRTVITSGKQGA
jgi:hypothetical protein